MLWERTCGLLCTSCIMLTQLARGCVETTCCGRTHAVVTHAALCVCFHRFTCAAPVLSMCVMYVCLSCRHSPCLQHPATKVHGQTPGSTQARTQPGPCEYAANPHVSTLHIPMLQAIQGQVIRYIMCAMTRLKIRLNTSQCVVYLHACRPALCRGLGLLTHACSGPPYRH